MDRIPLLQLKDAAAPSVFEPANLLREARRQRGLPYLDVPPVCVLDPDGDMVRHLRRSGEGRLHAGWACYHTEMLRVDRGNLSLGIVGCAVGAPFAVLVAEQMFASGCRFLVSVTSAGQIAPAGTPPFFVLIEQALRDEGTSLHYGPPSRFAGIDPETLGRLAGLTTVGNEPVLRGATWTTDAPYRETAAAIAAHRAEGILAVEMEAAALYAFSLAKGRPVACFAHVTNTMAQNEGDFEKGECDGALAALDLVEAAARAWLAGEGR
jgi:uridine phosphorylase